MTSPGARDLLTRGCVSVAGRSLSIVAVRWGILRGGGQNSGDYRRLTRWTVGAVCRDPYLDPLMSQVFKRTSVDRCD